MSEKIKIFAAPKGKLSLIALEVPGFNILIPANMNVASNGKGIPVADGVYNLECCVEISAEQNPAFVAYGSCIIRLRETTTGNKIAIHGGNPNSGLELLPTEGDAIRVSNEDLEKIYIFLEEDEDAEIEITTKLPGIIYRSRQSFYGTPAITGNIRFTRAVKYGEKDIPEDELLNLDFFREEHMSIYPWYAITQLAYEGSFDESDLTFSPLQNELYFWKRNNSSEANPEADDVNTETEQNSGVSVEPFVYYPEESEEEITPDIFTRQTQRLDTNEYPNPAVENNDSEEVEVIQIEQIIPTEKPQPEPETTKTEVQAEPVTYKDPDPAPAYQAPAYEAPATQSYQQESYQSSYEAPPPPDPSPCSNE